MSEPSDHPIFPRSSGILLHPTSLPGPYGIGDLGTWAYRFVDLLVEAGQTLWQVLPLGPTGFGESPYQCLSSFAGNTNLISLDRLVDWGWLEPEDVADPPHFSAIRADYAAAIAYHDQLLSLAYDRFVTDSAARAECEAWSAEPERDWLDDFALFASLKEFYGGRAWVHWTEGEALRESAALGAARRMHVSRMAEHRFRQWVFFRQWADLKAYANARGVRIVGDIPIYTAHDSSDVWASPELFELDELGHPTYIAGVPPDYFSSTGQRWGNPLYNWPEHRLTGYAWWVKRMAALLRVVDVVRIDHFRAFDRYYRIPASRPTAQGGRWVNGPKLEFFQALSRELGRPLHQLPIIAEDLGDNLGEAIKLREDLHLPGMAILQFAFGENESERRRFDPNQPALNVVTYTGTHDNNTVMGWWHGEASAADQQRVRDYLGRAEITEPHWELIGIGMKSSAHTMITPMQDVLGAGASARMNRPGVPSGQWAWRCTARQMEAAPWDRLRDLTRANNR